MLRVILIFMFFSAVTYATYIEKSHLYSAFDIDIQSCTPANCTDGLQCNNNCTGIQICSNNELCDTVTCQDGWYCDDKFPNKCYEVPPEGITCRGNYKFECTGAGVFPDPFDCDKYYCCDNVNQEPEPLVCDTGYMYDPIRNKCILRECTTSPVPECVKTNNLQCNLLPNYPYIYYVCEYVSNTSTSKIPKLYNCESGLFYPTQCRCETELEKEKASVKLANCPSPNSNVTASPLSTTTPTPVPLNCSTPYEFFEVSDNCHFCYCQPSCTCDVRECKTGTYYNKDYKRCVPGQCTL